MRHRPSAPRFAVRRLANFATIACLVHAPAACSPGAGGSDHPSEDRSERASAQPSEHPVEGHALGATIRGASVEPPRGELAPGAWDELAATGVEWVAVVPYVFVDAESGELPVGRPERIWGDAPGGVRDQVAEARRLSLKVLLKPHVWVRGAGGWPGEYLPGSDTAWRSWESGYRSYLLEAAAIAEELELEMLAVGTELTRLVEERPAFFRELIEEIREVYSGPITYAANWDAYHRTPLWDLVDYIGIDAYFPLLDDPEADVAALVDAWHPVVAELEELSARYERPILFTEWGYRSVSGAAGRQWLLPSERRPDPATRDEGIQARAYEAFFRTWWDRPWVAGGFFWNWHLARAGEGGAQATRASEADAQATRAGAGDTTGARAGAGEGERTRARGGTGFDPRGKEAEEVIRRWYGAG